MPCPDLELLEQFVTGAVAPDQHHSLEAHFLDCTECQAHLRDIKANRAVFGKLDAVYAGGDLATCSEPGAVAGSLPADAVSSSPDGLNARRSADDQAPASSEIRLPGYEIVREISRGGQGVVYQAQQESTHRKVAIKVLKAGHFADDREVARFEREVHILGQLKHPNIVTIHESGRVGGNAFFVMDYISGKALDAHVAEQSQSIDDVLRLMVRVYDAVHSAHLRGVIHRDLKPSNIRIDADGEPQVLDFGLAKMAETPDESDTPVMTVTGQFLGSLPWSSPEQAKGLSSKIDLRTDVYSLGVAFYHLLTGQFPYDVVGNMRDVLDQIIEAEPTKPSTVRRQINDEVETIVLKCLQKERNRRYQTAGEVARDIRHYLCGEPIEAKRDSTLYVLNKTLRRHKVPVALAGLLFLAVAAFGVVSAVQAYRIADQAEQITDERNRAIDAQAQEARARKAAEEVAGFLEDLFLRADPELGLGADPSVRQVLATAAARIDTELQDQPLVRARLMEVLGSVHQKLGDFERAGGLLDAALDLRQDELGDDHPDVATSLLSLGRLLTQRGEHAAADAQLQRALAIRRQHFGDQGAPVAEAWEKLGGARAKAFDYAGAVEHLRKSLEIHRLSEAPDQPDVLRVKNALGYALAHVGKHEEAETLLNDVLKTRRGLGDERAVADTLSNLAVAAWNRRDPNEAERFLAQQVDTLRSACREDDPAIPAALGDYAFVMGHNHGPAAAVPMRREALAITRSIYGADHPQVATCMSDLGKLLSDQGEFAEAQTLLADTLAIVRGLYAEQDDRIAIALNNLAEAYRKNGQHEQAEPLLREALDMWKTVHGEDHDRVGVAMQNLGALKKAMGDLEAAEAFYRSAMECYRRSNSPNLGGAYNQLGSLAWSTGDFATAADHYRQALELWQNSPGRSPIVAVGMNNLGSALRELGRLGEAEPLLREALDRYRERHGAGAKALIIPLANLAVLLVEKGEAASAERLCREALDIGRKQMHPESLRLAYPLVPLGSLLSDRGDAEAAEPLLREAVRIFELRQSSIWEPLRARAALATCLRQQGRLEEAESVLAEVVDLARNSLSENHWHTGAYLDHYGQCLVRMRRFDEAEAALLEAHEMMVSAMGADHLRTVKIKRSLVDLYETWHGAEPDAGHDSKAAAWRKKLQ